MDVKSDLFPHYRCPRGTIVTYEFSAVVQQIWSEPQHSALGLSGLPHSRSQKGGKPKRQRSKVPPTIPDNYTLCPGLVSISSGNAVLSPIVQVSEPHQPLNVSTTVSLLPETSHVNLSGVVQELFNAFTF